MGGRGVHVGEAGHVRGRGIPPRNFVSILNESEPVQEGGHVAAGHGLVGAERAVAVAGGHARGRQPANFLNMRCHLVDIGESVEGIEYPQSILLSDARGIRYAKRPQIVFVTQKRCVTGVGDKGMLDNDTRDPVLPSFGNNRKIITETTISILVSICGIFGINRTFADAKSRNLS